MLPPSIDATIPPDAERVNDIDPNISKLLVSHYDCTKQNNLRQFSLTRVQPCTPAPTSLEYTRVIASVYVRAKAKRLKAWTCEAYANKERFMCSQTNVKYRRHDRNHQKTLLNALSLLIQMNAKIVFASSTVLTIAN